MVLCLSFPCVLIKRIRLPMHFILVDSGYMFLCVVCVCV